MRTGRRLGLMAILSLTALAGCRAVGPGWMPDLPPPNAPKAPPTLPSSAAVSGLEPALKSLPTLDPNSTDLTTFTPAPTGYLSLSEEVCRKEASSRSSLSGLLVHENEIPPVSGDSSSASASALLTEVRFLVAEEARNRAAAQALEQFFQLADAEGRAEIIRASLPVLDQLRTLVRKARSDGLRLPVDPDELDRQRGSLLTLISQADLASRLLDLDLKRRLGVSAKGGERLRPVGPFAVNADPFNADAAVQVALERRADLRMLRAVYLQLTPETLPTARDVVRRAAEIGGLIGPGGLIPTPPVRTVLYNVATRNAAEGPSPEVIAEIAVRRQQLFDLIGEHERAAADQVRAAALTLDAQTRQVGLARWRAEQLLAKAEDAKAQGPLVELPAILEAYRSRAEVVAAAMAWQQARVKLLAAQGGVGE